MATADELPTTIKTVDYETYSDLKDKYDSLLQKLKTTMLEKQQYHIELSQQTELLSRYESQRSSSSYYEQFTQPLLTSSLQSMSTELEASYTMRETMEDQNNEYKQLTQKLQKENNKLKIENKRYQETVERMTNNEYKKQLEYDNNITQLKKEIQVLKKQEVNIYEKYEEKVSAYDALKSEMETELQKHMENMEVSPGSNKKSSFHARWQKSLSKNEFTQLIQKHGSGTSIGITHTDSSHSLPEWAEYDSELEVAFLPTPKAGVTAVIPESRKTDEMEEITLESQRKDEEIEKLNKFIAKLKKENKHLMVESRNECRACVGFRWSK